MPVARPRGDGAPVDKAGSRQEQIEPASPFSGVAWSPALEQKMANLLHQLLRLDYVSCILTILASILLGRKLWQGWVVAAVNSAVVCVIGVRTAQFGFVPANLLCIALYTSNLVTWRFRSSDHAAKQDSKAAS